MPTESLSLRGDHRISVLELGNHSVLHSHREIGDLLFDWGCWLKVLGDLKTKDRRHQSNDGNHQREYSDDWFNGALHGWGETLWLRPDLLWQVGSAARLIEKGVVCWLHWIRGLLREKPIRRFREGREVLAG
jgi:hypothetical protein